MKQPKTHQIKFAYLTLISEDVVRQNFLDPTARNMKVRPRFGLELLLKLL